MIELGADIKQIISKCGGGSRVARRLGVSKQAISQWKKVPKHFVRSVALMARCKPEEIRPDWVVGSFSGVSVEAARAIAVEIEHKSMALGQKVAFQAERAVRLHFSLEASFARAPCRFRQYAIYLAMTAIDGVNTQAIAMHFMVSRQACEKARSAIADRRDDDADLDAILDALCDAITGAIWGAK